MKIVYCVIYSCYDSLFVCEFQGLPSHWFPVIFFFVNWYILTVLSTFYSCCKKIFVIIVPVECLTMILKYGFCCPFIFSLSLEDGEASDENHFPRAVRYMDHYKVLN